MRRVESSRREVAREGGPERRAGGARHRWRERAERDRQGKGKRDPFAISKNFQGPKCKTRITFKLKLKWKSAQHESCSIFQDLQLLFCAKIYLTNA